MAERTLAQIRADIRRDSKWLSRVDEVTARRDKNVRAAQKLGASTDDLAADTNLTPRRVSQIAPTQKKRGRPPKVRPEAAPAAEESDPERVPAAYRVPLMGDELPARFQPGVTGGLKTLLSDVVTDRWGVKGPERATVFVDMASGRWVSVGGQSGQITWTHRTAAEMLTQLPPQAQRVFLVGARPRVPSVADPAEACRAWYLAPPPPGWTAGAHYLEDADLPIGRWTRDGDDGQAVEVARAAAWFGPGEYSAERATQAWAVLRHMIKARFGYDALLLTTPSSTGRDLWRRTIGRDRKGQPKTYPVLSAELRQLIQSTSGQGRWEVIPEGPQDIETFTHWDMRFAYSALAWGLPVGRPEMVTGRAWAAGNDEDRAQLLARRGRWLVTATVPDGWEHVGLLGAPSRDGLWCYPRRPGERFTTWVGGSEAHLASRHGWRMEVHEGFTFNEGKPLNDWAKTITTLYQETDENPDIAPDLRVLVRGALRMLVLTAVGAFAARSRPVTKSLPATRENEQHLPKTAPVRVVDGSYVWTEQGDRRGWSERTDHPEWPAEIWARCRVRLLDSPTADPAVRAGALHVPPGTVLAMRVDGLSLGCDPGWTDDGAMGRFRLKGRIPHGVARPINESEGEACRRQAARMLAGGTA